MHRCHRCHRPHYSIFAAGRSFHHALKPYRMSFAISSSASPKTSLQQVPAKLVPSNGDLNNLSAIRPVAEIAVDAAFVRRSLAIQESEDDPEIRRKYRPFLLAEDIEDSDWIASLEMSTAVKMAHSEMHRTNGGRLKVLVLYGSLRERCVTRSDRLSMPSNLMTH